MFRLKIYFGLFIHLNYLTNDIDILFYDVKEKRVERAIQFQWANFVKMEEKAAHILKVTNEVSPYLGIAKLGRLLRL